jgi:hypothetical protein
MLLHRFRWDLNRRSGTNSDLNLILDQKPVEKTSGTAKLSKFPIEMRSEYLLPEQKDVATLFAV